MPFSIAERICTRITGTILKCSIRIRRKKKEIKQTKTYYVTDSLHIHLFFCHRCHLLCDQKQNKGKICKTSHRTPHAARIQHTHTADTHILGHINECVDIVIVASHIFVLDQPFQLFFDHFLRRQKHISQYINQFRL